LSQYLPVFHEPIRLDTDYYNTLQTFMNLFKTAQDAPFLETVADFILDRFNTKLDKVKVVVPSRFIATNLQKIIIGKRQYTILPDIIPYHGITAGSNDIFKFTGEQVNCLSSLEEQIMLAGIIYNHEGLKYNVGQCLKFAPLLARLFDELRLNKIDIKNIEHLPTLNQAEHWKFIYGFLNYAHENLLKQAQDLGKITGSAYKINIVSTERGDEGNTVIAGFIGEDKTAWDYIAKIAMNPNNYIILPPFPVGLDKSLESDNLYCLRSLLNSLGKKLEDFRYCHPDSAYESKSPFDGILNKLVDDDCTNAALAIQYIEASDVFEESEVIATICKKFTDKKIAIIVCNNNASQYYKLFLKKYEIKFQSLLGSPLIQTKPCELILSLSDFLCNEFDLKKLFILLKNSLIINHEVSALEKLLTGSNRFVSSYTQITKILQKHGDNALSLWWENLIQIIGIYRTNLKNCHPELDSGSKKPVQGILNQVQDDEDFTDLLTGIIKICEKLAPSMWSKEIQGAEELANLFSEIIACPCSLNIKDRREFCTLLKTLLNGVKIFDNIDNQNILICYPHEAAYLKFDLVILADFSYGNWPPEEDINPWLNKEMQKELGFYPEQIKSNAYLYNFYLLLHNPKIFITRSVRQGSKELLPSNYIHKLQHIIGKIAHCHPELVSGSNTLINEIPKQVRDDVNPDPIFPSKLSATDIELLVRSPYIFYIKKILGLKTIDHINAKPKLSEFGNFIHSVIEEYSKNYDDTKNLINVGERILENLLLPPQTKKVWDIKLKALAKEFINFDEARRSSCKSIYSEIKGSIALTVLGKNIELHARADRLEVDASGYISILDYKTGALPTKKEINSGLSPQLIVLALIALGGGFQTTDSNKVKELIYVKIGSSAPYIQTLEIKISELDLEVHKAALIKLLEYYISTKNFTLETNLLKYNDYKHFTRE
jgi:ATP-dependent helicase/nuclease subunit B